MACVLTANDTSLSSIVHDVNISFLELISNSAKINEWAFKGKLSFNSTQLSQL